MAASRTKPNILITGTPGTGKSSLSELVVEKTGFTSVNIGELAKEKGFHDGYDEEFDTLIIGEAAEDKLLDDLEDQMEEGGVVVEHHSNDFFPERWFDLVVVLRTNNTVLYDRLKARGYNDNKITENVTAEIMEVVSDQARSSYAEEVVVELDSNTIEDLESNADRIAAWTAAWIKNNN